MSQKLPKDLGYETWMPQLEDLLDRHHAEAIRQAASHHRSQMAAIFKLKEAIMATLDQVLEQVSASDTKLDSVIALIDGLKQQVADVLSGANLPPSVQSKVDAIFAKATSNAAKIADALDENVVEPPVEPTP